MSKVKALYDFNGEPNTSELTITVGEILTVTSYDVGEGWWEGTNARGQRGLFPAAYVEAVPITPVTPVVTSSQNAHAPPALAGNQNRYDQATDDWGEENNEWDDDWDDDNDTYSEIGPAAPPITETARPIPTYYNANLPATPNDGDNVSITSSSGPRKVPTKVFSSFLMGAPMNPVAEAERIYVLQMENGIIWKPTRDAYTVIVDSPKKEKKFNGLKSFIAYQLTPSFNNIPVSRRYKHFDWLHIRLVEKFSLIPIPPLPDKQISGRYDEEFVEHRRVQLQEFVDWVCRHPILSTCEVWMHFLTCTDEKKWKHGKRMAEKDPLQGSSFCHAVYPPEKQLLPSQVDPQVDSCNLFVPAMTNAVKTLIAMTADQTKKFQLQWKQDYQKIGEGFSELARALEIDERRTVTVVNLSQSVGHAAGIFIKIGTIFAEQPKHDYIPFSDRLHIYRGIIGSFPDALNDHKHAIQKRKECEKLTAEQKMENSQLQEVNRRVETMSYALIAEMNHFRAERDTHLQESIKNFIEAQIVFYKDVVSKLEQARSYF